MKRAMNLVLVFFAWGVWPVSGSFMIYAIGRALLLGDWWMLLWGPLAFFAATVTAFIMNAMMDVV